MSERLPTLYTAGAMRWRNDEDSTWRRSVDVDVSNSEFLHPDADTFFDHGGDFVKSCVSEDMALLARSDGVIAYFTHPDQVGTIIELLHGLMLGKPALVAYDPEMGDPIEQRGPGEDPQLPLRVGSVEFRGESDEYWFLRNYLAGDSAQGEQRNVPDHIPPWTGKHTAEQWVVGGSGMSAVVSQWAERTFNRRTEAGAER